MTDCIAEYVGFRRRAPLLYARDCQPSTVQGCEYQVAYTVLVLREHGLGLEDRMGVVLPNGPALALRFRAVSSAAAFAPLNPQLSISESISFCGI